MPFNKPACQISGCGKPVEISGTFQIDGLRMHTLKCGHMIRQDQMSSGDVDQLVALNGNKLMPFQKHGVRFIEDAGGRAGVLDEMGLGKTVQALAWLYLHREAWPALIICKTSLQIQWQRQVANWCSDDWDDGYRFAQIISSSKESILPGIKFVIISFDIIRRFNSKDKDRTGHYENRFEQMLIKWGCKTVIIDECQQIKNSEAQRTEEVRKLAKVAQYVIALSGTPIKNNAGEYFPVLNMIKPEVFHNYAAFLRNDVDAVHGQFGYRIGGLKDAERFKEKTDSFLIRRTRQEVLPELPLIDRHFMFHELGAKVEQEYIRLVKEFQQDYNTMGSDKDFGEKGHILAYLSRMRHLTGYAKIDPCLDFCMEFLASSDDERLCIFCHHIDVADILTKKLSILMEKLGMEAPMNLVGLGAAFRENQKDQWVASKSRILILSTLASGEGLDGLQRVCYKLITLEREWNPANEEQVEGRFSRIGSIATSVDNTFFVAVGTVDEFFARIVEQKREIVTKTLGGEAVSWDQSSIIKELAEVLSISGGKQWNF